MDYNDIFDEVVSGLHASDLPSEYILLARLIDHFGGERILRGVELERFLRHPESTQNVAEASVVLDVRKIRVAILESLMEFFNALHARIATLPPLNAL